MANPIRRVIQFVLDKASAQQAAKEAKKTTEEMDKDVSKVESKWRKLGETIVAALGIEKLFEFGKKAIEAAEESQEAWSNLAGTIDNTGGSFEALEEQLHATAEAFQDFTDFTTEDYAKTVQHLTRVSGDWAASINNVGLTANVAARFFKGDLAAAADLVGKVMSGNIRVLRQMGIQVNSAQEGLKILGERSFGAATDRANTFAGRLRNLNNMFHEFKEVIGETIINSDGAGKVIDALRGGIVALTEAVKSNAKELDGGLEDALAGVVIGVDGVYRGFRAAAQVIGGIFLLAVQAVLSPVAIVNRSLALMAEGAILVAKSLGLEGATMALQTFQGKLIQLDKYLSAPGRVAGELFSAVPKELSERTQLAEDVLAGMRNPAKRRKPPKGLLDQPGQMGKFAPEAEADERTKAISKALEDYIKSVQSAQAMSELLGDKFDLLKAKSEALETVIKALSENGFDAANPLLQGFADELGRIQEAMDDAELAERLAQAQAHAAALGAEFDLNGAQADAYLAQIDKLIKRGIDPASERIQNLVQKARDLGAQAKLGEILKDTSKSFDELAESEFLAGERLDESGKPLEESALRLDELKNQAEILTQALLDMKAFGFQDDPIYGVFLARLRTIQGQIKMNIEETKAMADAAKLAGEVVGAAITGGLGDYAQAKARAAFIESAEEAARGFAAALSLFGAAEAPKHFALAAKFAAIGVAWTGLAKSGIGQSAPGGGGSGGARSASGAQAQAAKPAETEVHIHLVGPGFNALNPAVQEVVFGAQQQARERYGNNAKVQLHRD